MATCLLRPGEVNIRRRQIHKRVLVHTLNLMLRTGLKFYICTCTHIEFDAFGYIHTSELDYHEIGVFAFKAPNDETAYMYLYLRIEFHILTYTNGWAFCTQLYSDKVQYVQILSCVPIGKIHYDRKGTLVMVIKLYTVTGKKCLNLSI